MRSRLHQEIEFNWIGGQRLLLRHGMSGATGNVYVGLQEFFDMMVPLHLLRPGDLFLDIGANVGAYTILASGVCRANTHAFEPDPNTFRRLKKNVAINKLDGVVEAHNSAVGATGGEVAFTVGRDTANRIATEGDSDTRRVRMECLDAIFPGDAPIMMKLDAEEAEHEVLLGAGKVLANPALKVIELETVTADSAAIMARNGFELAAYDPFSRTLSRQGPERKSANSLYVRDRPFVETRLKSAPPILVLGQTI
ncbi:MAG TPA: FkbM family methyltransferase [Terracidiphilus sp.]|nr:FkbM family methyltransferase [Terracidiphilus sp.]